MSTAKQCDSCSTLFKPVAGTVALQYEICEGGNTYQGYSADDTCDRFALCLKCSANFLAFIHHEDGKPEDGVRVEPLPVTNAP